MGDNGAGGEVEDQKVNQKFGADFCIYIQSFFTLRILKSFPLWCTLIHSALRCLDVGPATRNRNRVRCNH